MLISVLNNVTRGIWEHLGAHACQAWSRGRAEGLAAEALVLDADCCTLANGS